MRILVDPQDHISSETWPAVINTIRHSLQAKDFSTMQVEILDPERCLVPFRCSITKDHYPLCMEHWISIDRSLFKTVHAYAPFRQILALASRERDADSCVI